MIDRWEICFNGPKIFLPICSQMMNSGRKFAKLYLMRLESISLLIHLLPAFSASDSRQLRPHIMNNHWQRLPEIFIAKPSISKKLEHFPVGLNRGDSQVLSPRRV